MQKGCPQIYRSGVDCDIPEAEVCSQRGVQEQEVHSSWSPSQEDPCYPQTPHQTSGMPCFCLLLSMIVKTVVLMAFCFCCFAALFEDRAWEEEGDVLPNQEVRHQSLSYLSFKKILATRNSVSALFCLMETCFCSPLVLLCQTIPATWILFLILCFEFYLCKLFFSALKKPPSRLYYSGHLFYILTLTSLSYMVSYRN